MRLLILQFFFILCPNILLSILFSNILHLCYYLRMSVQVPCIYTTGSNISFFYFNLYIFRQEDRRLWICGNLYKLHVNFTVSRKLNFSYY